MGEVELSENGFARLTSAVNLAKQHQCKSIDQLKSRLSQNYPDSQESIEEALKFWGNKIRVSSLHEITLPSSQRSKRKSSRVR